MFCETCGFYKLFQFCQTLHRRNSLALLLLFLTDTVTHFILYVSTSILCSFKDIIFYKKEDACYKQLLLFALFYIIQHRMPAWNYFLQITQQRQFCFQHPRLPTYLITLVFFLSLYRVLRGIITFCSQHLKIHFVAFVRDNILINPLPRKHMYITYPNIRADDVYPNRQDEGKQTHR